MRWLLAVALWLVASVASAQTMYLPHYVSTDGAAFATVAASHADYQALTYPTFYTTLPFDYSSWDRYDGTCECVDDTCVADDTGVSSCVPGSGTIPFLNSWGCTEMAGDDSTDDAAALACLLNNIGENALVYLPNNTYRIIDTPDGASVWRPSFNFKFRGIIGESQSAILNFVPAALDPDASVALYTAFDGEDAVFPAASRSWNGGSGAASGSTTILLSDTSGFSATDNASGNWVVLNASPNSGQPDSCCRWISRVTAISPGTSITIEHPIPKAFDGGSATARPYNPSIGFVMDGFTIKWDDSVKDHQNGSWTLLQIKNMVEVILNDMKFSGSYRQFITMTTNGSNAGNADVFIMHSDFLDPRWDKGANGYGLVVSDTDRGWIHDNSITHSTGIAISTDSDANLITFNYIPSPDGACTDVFDTPTTGTQTSGSEDGRCDNDPTQPVGDQLCNHGDGNDCTVWEGFHSAAHGVTQSPDAYGHCSGSYNDAKGLQGDTGCHHGPTGKVYSCIEWHGASGAQTGFMRNYCEGGIWFDDETGFDDLLILGNWFHDTSVNGGVSWNTAGASEGEMAVWRDVTGPTNTSWRHASIYAGNVLDGSAAQLGSSGGGFDAWGNGVQVLDNAIEGACYSENASPPTGCSSATTSLTDSTSTTFSRNNVGSDTYTGGVTIPTLPGTSFTSWGQITFSATPSSVSAPYVGVEMGDPDSLTPCLPARARLDSC